NGRYHTGDLAWKDEDGHIWFVGRNDDMIKCSGYRIGPFEIESVLLSHPAVKECAITGAPDPLRGQVVKASIVLHKGYEGTDELTKELQTYVKKMTAPYKYPRIVCYMDALPKTVTGKINRKAIRNE
ncbi:MAG: AMP-binding protein, partial [Clostridia bacterium]|nr:AMP-binding protein [Clostridia bacterium]